MHIVVTMVLKSVCFSLMCQFTDQNELLLLPLPPSSRCTLIKKTSL